MNKNIDYRQLKYINNTGTVPGVVIGQETSPWFQMKRNMGSNSFIGSNFDNAINQGSGISNVDRTPQLLGMKDPYVENPNLKPTATTEKISTDGSGIDMGQIGMGVSSIPTFIQNMHNSWTDYDSEDEIRARYKDTTVNVGGISYNVQEPTGEKHKDNTVNNVLGSMASGASIGGMAGPEGAAIGAIVGGIGAGIGAVFSHKKQKQKEQLMAYKTNSTNNFRTGLALTEGIRLNDSKQHGDTSQQYLYGSKNGKLPGFEIGKQPSVDPKTGLTKRPYLTDTAYGTMYMPANGLGKPGEIMSDMRTGATSEIAPGLPGSIGDKIPIYADKNTAILTDDWIDPVTKKTYAQAAKDGDDSIQNLVDRMAVYVNPSKQTKYAKNGRLPKFKEGSWANTIISGLGGLAGLSQYLTAANNKPYRPSTYVENPYEIEALSTLAGLQVNPYPILQNVRAAETRANRAIDRSGGLSTAQRNMGRLSALYGTQNNIANTLSAIQQQNNQYKANYAQAALNAGNASRQARMSANQFDLDYYSKAHAARQLGMQTGIQNMLAQAQNWYKNDFKRRQFNDTIGLYRSQQQQDINSLQQQADQFSQQMMLSNKQLDLQKQQNQYLDILNNKDKLMEWMKNKGWS